MPSGDWLPVPSAFPSRCRREATYLSGGPPTGCLTNGCTRPAPGLAVPPAA